MDAYSNYYLCRYTYHVGTRVTLGISKHRFTAFQDSDFFLKLQGFPGMYSKIHGLILTKETHSNVAPVV